MNIFELKNPSELSGFQKTSQYISSAGDIRTTSQKWFADAKKIMKKYGFEAIGAGSYAGVWEHSSYPYVVKIFRSDDKAYIAWLNWCKSHQSNSLVPKIKGNMVKINPYFLCVRLEKLTKILNAWSIGEQLESLLTGYTKGLETHKNKNSEKKNIKPFLEFFFKP